MNRKILGKPNFEKDPYGAKDGLLIITSYQNTPIAVYSRENRIYAAMSLEKEETIGTVYMGKISRVIKNSSVCFVEYLKGKMGFLPFSNIPGNPPKEGDLLMVMLEKESIKSKLPTFTAKISLQSQYFVFDKENTTHGFSKKLSLLCRKERREWLQEELTEDCPYGVVVRTDAELLNKEEFIKQYRIQKARYEEMIRKAKFSTAYCVLYENNDIKKLLLNIFRSEECRNIVTDQREIFEKLEKEQEGNADILQLRFYEDDMLSLIKLYRLETLLAEALRPTVWLKSGGNIVIEQTEGLTAIDVNAAKNFSEASMNNKNESSNYLLNLEAAKEIALQIRLRNISGIIIIDFLKMKSKEEEKKLLDAMKEYTGKDPKETAVIDITPLGLMELTRKKGLKSLKEQLSCNREVKREEEKLRSDIGRIL